ncbi:MAG: monovalent cation/H(+) antiporter subunit G [Bacteroidales bacterium]
MMEWIAFILMILGAFFIFVSALGLLTLPDLYMRMHAATKTTSNGIILILLAVIAVFPELSTLIKTVAIIIFIFLTTPLSTHMISKAGYMLNVKKWENYSKDETKETEM